MILQRRVDGVPYSEAGEMEDNVHVAKQGGHGLRIAYIGDDEFDVAQNAVEIFPAPVHQIIDNAHGGAAIGQLPH